MSCVRLIMSYFPLKRPSGGLSEIACTFAALLVCLATVVAPAQEQPSGAKLKLSIGQELGFTPLAGLGGSEQHVEFFGSFTIEKGTQKGILSLAATIEPGWHIYSITQPPKGPAPSKITVGPSTNFKVLGPFQPDKLPHVKPSEVFPVPEEEHEGTVIWSAPIELAAGVNPESLTVELRYDGQVCSKSCIPLSNIKVEAKFAGYTAPPETPGEYHPSASQAQVVLTGHIEPARSEERRGGKGGRDG